MYITKSLIKNKLHRSVSIRNPGNCETNNLCIHVDVCISQFPQRESRVWYVYIQILRQNVLKLYANITQVLTDAKEINHEPAWKALEYLHTNLSKLFFSNKKVFRSSRSKINWNWNVKITFKTFNEVYKKKKLFNWDHKMMQNFDLGCVLAPLSWLSVLCGRESTMRWLLLL